MGLFDRFLNRLGFKGKPKFTTSTPEGGRAGARRLQPGQFLSQTEAGRGIQRGMSGQPKTPLAPGGGTTASKSKGAVRRGLGKIKDKIPTVAQFQGRTDLDDFLFFGVWYDNFSSSNVAAFRYLEDAQILFVRFRSGAVYGYEPATPHLAKAAWTAKSKGGFVWDKLRIRHTAYGHQLNYYYDQGQSTHIPMYRLEGGEREARHDREALEEGGKYTGFFTGGTPGKDEL